ncbi:MAG: M18 family aminopeptidase [Sphaerochaeta sp.]|nr:M18 family aminopeptidase [Sphaerochaeta sp.]
MKLANELIDFIHEGPSPFHVVRQTEAVLEAAGFTRLEHTKRWKLDKGGRYYVTTNGSALIAWIVGSGELEDEGFRLVQTHVDSPSIRIKPSPEMAAAGGFLKLNAEVYGSPILSTWLDRPLALAGRVSLRSAAVMHPKQVLVDFPDPQLYIPNISIHHNKGVNAGVELNPQKDMLPILGLLEAGTVGKDTLRTMLADRIGCKAEDILDYDLYTSEYERGCLLGRKGEFISSKKLDNLSLVYASARALAAQTGTTCTPVICCLDNEEIGNRTRQGADSPMLATVLERIASSLGKDREDFFRAMQNSFMLSADMSHAVHPNAPDRSDPVVQVKLNGGPVIKFSGAQKFTTNSESSAVFQQLCELAQVPWQYYVNKSDSPGGSAAGTDSVTQADMRSVDIGLALLAMHSIREIGGTADNAYMHAVLERFFKQGN